MTYHKFFKTAGSDADEGLLEKLGGKESIQMKASLYALARLVDGEVSGNGETEIHAAATIRDVQPGEITFAQDEKYLGQLEDSPAAAAVIGQQMPLPSMPSIRVADVTTAFAQIVQHFVPPREVTTPGISPLAHVSPLASLAGEVSIGPGVSIGDHVEIGENCQLHAGVQIMAGCRLGANVTLFPNVVLYENSELGDRVCIHAGSCIGAYGFGYQVENGRHERGYQLGNVIIENDVEIGAGTTIDRGTYGPTRIGEGTKIDNQVMIAHNCRIGKHNLICSQVGIAGSSTTGDYVVLAGQVGIRDHVNIGDRVVIGAQSGVMADIVSDSRCLGSPATGERDQMVIQAAIRKLPILRRQLQALRRRVDEVSGQTPAEASRDETSTNNQDAA